MSKITSPPPIRHIFSHPLQVPEYRQLHEDYQANQPFFSFTDLGGETHFPDLEIPEKCVDQVEEMIRISAQGN
jgi:hypothetical protein